MRIRVHPVFWAAFLISIPIWLIHEYIMLMAAATIPDMITAAVWYVRVFFLLIATVTIHEMTHVLVGHIFHARVSELVITPLGEAAVLKGLDRSRPSARGAVILAGPAMNLAIGITGVCLFGAAIFDIPDAGFNGGYFFAANMALGLFNLLPALPLDGGRLCQLILGNLIGVSRANRVVCRLSRIIAALLITAGLVQMILFAFNMSLYLIGVYIIKNLTKERLKLSFDFFCYFSPGRRAAQRVVPIKFFAVTPAMQAVDLIDCLRWDTYSVFNVYFKNGDIASFTENDLMGFIKDNGLTGRAGEIVFEEV